MTFNKGEDVNQLYLIQLKKTIYVFLFTKIILMMNGSTHTNAQAWKNVKMLMII